MVGLLPWKYKKCHNRSSWRGWLKNVFGRIWKRSVLHNCNRMSTANGKIFVPCMTVAESVGKHWKLKTNCIQLWCTATKEVPIWDVKWGNCSENVTFTNIMVSGPRAQIYNADSLGLDLILSQKTPPSKTPYWKSVPFCWLLVLCHSVHLLRLTTGDFTIQSKL